MEEKEKDKDNYRSHLSKIKMKNMLWPILIGLGVVGWLIWRDLGAEPVAWPEFTLKTLFWLLVAFLFMAGRDLGYIIRLRVLSEGKLSWYESFRIIMLWEFTSAITPSAVGGTSFAIIYVHKGGLSVGRSSAIVLLTSFFDELYFIIMFPLLVILLGWHAIFDVAGASPALRESITAFLIAGYSLKFAYTLFISYGLFVNPRGLKWIIVGVFRLRWLRRWRKSAAKAGDDIIESSKALKSKPFAFWLKVFGSTFLSWSSRYLVVNALLLAFFTFGDHLLLFARQLVMWIMMLVMPTPGGSGFSEYFFREYLGEFIPAAGMATILALLWRLVTYYPYLLVGAVVFPRWLRVKFGNKKA